jgi:hypothetical protein
MSQNEICQAFLTKLIDEHPDDQVYGQKELVEHYDFRLEGIQYHAKYFSLGEREKIAYILEKFHIIDLGDGLYV